MLDITDLAIESIDPHPHNPRNWSDLYNMRVDEDMVEILMNSIRCYGYDPYQAIQVRPVGDRYKIFAGHHRLCAQKALGNLTIPAFIDRGISEEDAAFRLLTYQGRSVDGWLVAEHAYLLCEKWGISRKLYEERTGYDRSAISRWINAMRVRHSVGEEVSLPVLGAATIASLPLEDWGWFSRLAIDKGLSVRGIQAGVKNLQELSVDGFDFLGTNEVRRRVAVDNAFLEDINVCATLLREAREVLSENDFATVLAKLASWKSFSADKVEDVLADVISREESVRECFDGICFFSRVPSESDFMDVGELLSPGGNLIVLVERPAQLERVLFLAGEAGLLLRDKLVWQRNDNVLSPMFDKNGLMNTCCDVLIFGRDGGGYFFSDYYFQTCWRRNPVGNLICFNSAYARDIPNDLWEFLMYTFVPKGGKVLSFGGVKSSAIDERFSFLFWD